MNGSPILEVRDLVKVFDKDLFKKKQTVIDHLSCIFPAGKCTGFMGHNGAGKTTTIKTIFGLIGPDKGEILFKGKTLSLQDKGRIGYMPEVNKLPANLSCHEILMHHLKVFRNPRIPKSSYADLVEKTLREVLLWEHKDKRVAKLSKGMGRRLSWAQATIHDPDLIILDEPFSGLDPLGRVMMSKLINKLRDQQKSIILCTHELWTVNEVCDELHILRDGKLAYSSINPLEGQLPRPMMNYQIVCTGLTKTKVEAIKESHKLNDWDYINHRDYLLRMGFGEYQDASQWLASLVNEGIVVLDFSKKKGFEEDDLLVYFDGEHKQ